MDTYACANTRTSTAQRPPSPASRQPVTDTTDNLLKLIIVQIYTPKMKSRVLY